MPRRDLVLTGLIAFGAGVAVGANWGKLRKKIGPLLEKFGLQMADLGDFLSENGMEDFAAEMKSAPQTKNRRRSPAKPMPVEESFVPTASRRTGRQGKFPAKHPAPSRKRSRRQPIIAREEEVPLATGTFGD